MKSLLLLMFTSFIVVSVESESGVKKSTQTHPRMIGGEVANRNDWRFIVYINFHQRQPMWKTCGGALVAPRYVVTAAHCVEDIVNDPKYITVGAKRLKRTESYVPGSNFTVTDIQVHPSFLMPDDRPEDLPFSLDSDIAVLKLKEEVTAKDFLTIALPNEDADISSEPGKVCRSAGWGAKQPLGESSEYEVSEDLMEIKVPLVDKKTCWDDIPKKNRKLYGGSLDNMICGGGLGTSETETACVGDSGSPLVCRNEQGEDVLAGVVTGGTPGCEPGASFLIFTEISKFREWIEEITTERKQLDR